MNLNKLDSITDSDYSIYSFDLFDTVIRRHFFTVEEVQRSSCLYLCGFLSESLSADAILEQRKRLTQSLKRSSSLQSQEPDLADILTSLLANHELHGGTTIEQLVEKAIDFEFSLELENLRTIPEAINLLDTLKQNEKHIICITDMYFDQAHIETLQKVKYSSLFSDGICFL